MKSSLCFFFFSVLILVPSLQANDNITWAGSRFEITFSGGLNLTPSGVNNVWENQEKFIKLVIMEESLSAEGTVTETLKAIQNSVSAVLLTQSKDQSTALTTLKSKELHSNTSFIRYYVIGGGSNNSFKLALSFPEAIADTFKNESPLAMLTSLSWKPVTRPTFSGLPFALPDLYGFKITTKYDNSLVLKSTDALDELDAILIISAIEKTHKAADIKQQVHDVLAQSKSLQEFEIQQINTENYAGFEIYSTFASATIRESATPVDILHWGFGAAGQIMVMQLIVDKTSTSVFRLEEIMQQVLSGLTFYRLNADNE